MNLEIFTITRNATAGSDSVGEQLALFCHRLSVGKFKSTLDCKLLPGPVSSRTTFAWTASEPVSRKRL